jgi:hypothetical protein
MLVRRRFAAGRGPLLAACVAALGVFSPAPVAHASDGTFTQIFCSDPDTGRGVVANDGEFPAGLRIHRSDHPIFDRAQSQAKCSGTMSGSRGVVLGTAGGSFTLPAADTGLTLRYEPGAGVTFSDGFLHRQSAVGSTLEDYWSIMVNRAWNDWQWASPQYDSCVSRWSDCRGRGTSDPYGFGNLVNVGREAEVNGEGKPLNGFKLLLRCAGGGCPADPGDFLRVFGGRLTLVDQTAPKVVSAPAGSLVGGQALKGTAEASFDASDTGSGVYRVRVVVDGQPQPWQSAHLNGGACQDIHADSDAYEFASSKPCRVEVNTAVQLDTTKVADGTRALKIQAEDAAGNLATLHSTTVNVDNVAPPSKVEDGTISGSARRGNNLLLQGATWDNGGAAGSPEVAVRWERCRRDGVTCELIDGAVDSVYVPGDADLNRKLRVVETAANSEGSASVRTAFTEVVTREDGTLPADNDGVDNDGDGTVDEPGETNPVPPTGGGGTGPGGDHTSGAGATPLPPRNGTNGASGAAGAGGAGGSGGATGAAASSGPLNGDGASRRARLTVAFAGGPSRGRVAFGKDATVVGRLVDEEGRPIRNAIVDVTETPALRDARAASGRPAATGPDGEFSYVATSTGGTRALVFGYRYQRQGAVVSQAGLTVTVSAGVRLSVRLKGVVASYSGRVLAGAMPRSGKLVIVQGRAKGGSWQTFASRRAGRNGAFKGRYRLKVRRPGKQLQFRVRVVSEAGWNYGPVTSKAVTRRVR